MQMLLEKKANSIQEIIFLGSFPPPEMVRASGGKIDSLYRDDLAIIKGLKNIEKLEIKVVTSPDIPSYPINRLYFGRRVFKEDNIISVSCLNISIIKQLWTIFSMLIEIYRVIKQSKSEKIVVIIPYVVFRHSITGYIIKNIWKNKVKLCTIVPDIFFPSSRFLQFLNRLSEKIASKSDYFVFYSEEMAKYYNVQSEKYRVIEGFQEISLQPIENNNENFNIVYAGSLNKRYGILRLLEAVISLNNLPIKLHLYGAGDADKEIKEIVKHHTNIKFYGKVSKLEAVSALYKADVLINPRSNNDGDYVKYSFPSKNIEYMGTGIPTILCKIASMPKEYFGYFIDAKEGSPSDLVEAILKVYKMSIEERKQFGIDAQRFIVERMNVNKQAANIIELINNE